MKKCLFPRLSSSRKPWLITAVTGVLLLCGAHAAHAQYCISGASSVADEDIFNVTFGSLSNTSDCSSIGPGSTSDQNLYSDYTSLTPPNITIGNTVPLSVEVGTCNTFGSTYDNVVGVFIDYNRDGIFDDVTELVYVSSASTDGPHIETANVIVPTSAVAGLTGMRVMCIETTDPNDVSGCASYSWGETEDYTINLVPAAPPPCITVSLNPLEGDTKCIGTTTLRWNKRTFATGYDVYLNTGTAAPTTIVSANQADTFYTFTTTANSYTWKAIPKNGALAPTGCGFFSFKAMASITPDITIARTPAADTLCPGDTVVFTATPVNPGAVPVYQWIKNGVNVGTNSTTYRDNNLTAADTVYIILASSVEGSCVTKNIDTSNSMHIFYRTAPSASLTTSGATTFCLGQSVVLSVPAGAAAYQWRNGNGIIAYANTNTFTAQYSGTYSVKVSAANGCNSYSVPTVVNASSAPVPLISRVGNVASVANYYATYQWYRNNAALPGATTNSITISRDGSYTVTVKDTIGCVGTSAYLPVNELAIGNTPGAEVISIYPNPSNGVVNINTDMPVNVVIRSMEGKIVLEKNATNTVNISPLANGVYLMQLTDKAGKMLKTEKLVKSSN